MFWCQEKEWARRARNVSLLTYGRGHKTAKCSTRKRRSNVNSSGGDTDKQRREARKLECAVRARRIREKAMDGCNGNPIKQCHRDMHSQSVIAWVYRLRLTKGKNTEEDSESGTVGNGSTGAELSIVQWRSTGRRGWRRKSKALPVTQTRKGGQEKALSHQEQTTGKKDLIV